jgi:hypothetical protein
VPPACADLVTVRHFGRNTLPAFTLFEKRFCRPRGVDARKPAELWGFNHQTMSFVTGPGYFIARQDPTRPEILIDYTAIRPAPEGRVRSRRNENASQFVRHMIDTLRRVFAHVTIGPRRARGATRQLVRAGEAGVGRVHVRELRPVGAHGAVTGGGGHGAAHRVGLPRRSTSSPLPASSRTAKRRCAPSRRVAAAASPSPGRPGAGRRERARRARVRRDAHIP